MGKYLKQFIDEVNHLSAAGLTIDGKLFTIVVHCFICDKPARSLIKGTKRHGGYSACERSEITGACHKQQVIYPFIDCKERSDESFRKMEDLDHHMYRSPLLDITPKIDMISTFILESSCT